MSVLYRIVAWHASFPFPPFDPPAIDHNGFLRAINLLTLNPPPYFNHRQHGVSTGEWGPHSGGLVKLRGKDDQDLRRRLFRSLADPTLTETAPENAHALTKIPTPRFFMYQPREKRPADTSTLEEDEDSDDPGQQVVVVAEEDERCIDLLDVVSAYPPGEDPLTSNPLRESYESILLTLPQQPYYLHEMQIPSLKLVNLFRLLAVVDPNDGNGQEEKEILEWTEQLLESATPDQTSYISWPEFDRGLCKSQVGLIHCRTRISTDFCSAALFSNAFKPHVCFQNPRGSLIQIAKHRLGPIFV